MAYASASDVANLCRGLLNSASTFDASTSPTNTAVSVWLSSGCAILEAQLTAWGYTVPVPTSTIAYNWLQDLNTLFASARAELSRTNLTLQPGERTRGQVFNDMFWKDLGRLEDRDLTLAGVTRDSTVLVYTGGISVADKDAVVSNTDRVEPRFKREQHRFVVGVDDNE
jgi:hypothetical protein